MVVVYSICGPIAGALVSECVPYFCLVGVSALCTTALCTHWTMKCEFVHSLSPSSLYDARGNVGCATVTAFVALSLVAIIGKLSRTLLAVVAELRSCVLNADDALLVRRCRRYVCVNVVVTCLAYNLLSQAAGAAIRRGGCRVRHNRYRHHCPAMGVHPLP